VRLLEGKRFVLVNAGVLVVIAEVNFLLVSDEDAERSGNSLGFVKSSEDKEVSDRVAEIGIIAEFELKSEMVGV